MNMGGWVHKRVVREREGRERGERERERVGGKWLACWPYMQATGVQVPVTARIQNCNGVPWQFESCLRWRSRAYKPQREGWLVVWTTKTKGGGGGGGGLKIE